MSTEKTAHNQPTEACIDRMASDFYKDRSSYPRLGVHSLLAPTLDISSMKRTYDEEFDSLQKNTCLCVIFDSGIKARRTHDPEYKDAVKAFFSAWSKDQLTRILPGSKEATDLFNLQLLDDMLSRYDPGHCVIGESHVLDAAISGFPARILEVFTSNKSMFMAATMVHCKAVLARFSADFLSAPAWPHVRTTSEQDPLERILPDCTISAAFYKQPAGSSDHPVGQMV